MDRCLYNCIKGMMMNTKEISSKGINQAGSGIAQAVEDHALVSVPMEERQSGFKLAMSPVGVATALVIFAIGGFTVLLSGFWIGLLAGLIAAIVGFTLSYFLGKMTYQTGMSSTVTSRFFGFGVKGSSLGAAIFAFMILGFLALESALLYEGTLLMFNLQDTVPVRIGLYGLLTLAWILLAIFGLQIALKASKFMIVITLVVTFYMIYQIYGVRGMDPMQVFNSTGVIPGGFWTKLSTALVLMGATAGTISLVTTDFARYCRNTQDVKVLALAGPLTQNLLMIVLGGLVIIGGVPEVAEYLMQRNAGMSPQQAAEAAGGFAMSNTGAFFVVLAGWVGFITIYAAQAKAQAVNAYSGSLALVNLLDALTGKKPGRAFMVVLGNIFALFMIAGGILGQFVAWLSYLGCMTMSLCGVMLADYYFVRKGQFSLQTAKVENCNWAGVLTLVITSGIGIALIATKTFELGFFVTLATSLLFYPVLRKLLPEGTATGYAQADRALDAAE